MQCTLTSNLTDVARASPYEGKTYIMDEFMSDIEHRILRSSNSISRPLSHGSTLPRGTDTLHETRKKRQSRSGEVENNIIPVSFNDNRGRKSDPPKVARIMRTTKPITAAPGPLNHKRIIRDQGQGIKERDAKKKIWSR